ncbi:hypothetical protein ACOSQ2_027296 [Xanthoceras sorbifolium]
MRSSEYEFEVFDSERQYVVKHDAHSCDYGLWVISGIPCNHAMTCITKKRDDVEQFVYDYLKKPSYLITHAHVIHAIPYEYSWPHLELETILPPIKKKKASRLRKSRRRGATEPVKVQRSVGFRCSNCQQPGNKLKCKEG